jgi:hypothetical protein
MLYQPGKDVETDDVVYTPSNLAKVVVRHFNPAPVVLEPCRGSGSFYRFFPKGSPWTEIAEGRDFFGFTEKVNWIITNPPWSMIRAFLVHSMEVADNIVFLMTVNHIGTQSRIEAVRDHHFGIKEICCVDHPNKFYHRWPRTGFQLAAIHFQRHWRGGTKWTMEDWQQ